MNISDYFCPEFPELLIEYYLSISNQEIPDFQLCASLARAVKEARPPVRAIIKSHNEFVHECLSLDVLEVLLHYVHIKKSEDLRISKDSCDKILRHLIELSNDTLTYVQFMLKSVEHFDNRSSLLEFYNTMRPYIRDNDISFQLIMSIVGSPYFRI